MEHVATAKSDRDIAFASARLALARAQRRHMQVRPHRAISRLTVGPSLLLQIVALPALFCGMLYFAQPYLFEFWQYFIVTWSTKLDMPLVAVAGNAVPTGLGIAWRVEGPIDDLPSSSNLAMTATLTLVAFLTSFAMKGRMFPLKYLVRILCVVQGLALAFFWLQTTSFPYDVADHANDLASMGYVLLMAIPVMLAFGYYVLSIGLGTKILYTILILSYFVVMVPFQVVGHALILQHFSILFMPILYICFGSLFDMLIFVALYSWAASNAPVHATT